MHSFRSTLSPHLPPSSTLHYPYLLYPLPCQIVSLYAKILIAQVYYSEYFNEIAFVSYAKCLL